MSRHGPAAACSACSRVGLRLQGGRCGTCRAKDRVEPCSHCGLDQTVSTRTETGAALCGTCRLRIRAATRTAELHASAATTITAWLGDLHAGVVSDGVVSDGVVLEAVTLAAPNLRQAEWLVTALDEGPGVLQASTSAPPVIDRVVAELVARGVRGIAPPCCARCRRNVWLSQRIDGQRACVSCARSLRAEPCSVCGTTREVTTRDARGGAVCSVCHRKDPARWESCARCTRVRSVVRRLDDGSGLCDTCNRRVATCSICGHERVCAGIAVGEPRCQPCTARRAACSWCGRTARVSVVWASGPVCSTCRIKGLEAKTTCSGCNQFRRPDPRHASGRCSACVGLPRFNVCAECGIEDRIYRAGRCMRCALGVAFDAIAAGPVDLAALRATLITSDSPRAVLRWLQTPFITTSIRELATGQLALSHDALDELGSGLAVTRLRGVLGQAGLLTPRDEVLSRLERWIAEQVAAVADPEQRRIVEAFANWHVLRRARRRAEHVAPLSSNVSRRQVRRAIEFLAFLRDHDRTLADCTQADLELWLAGPSERRNVDGFVKWAHRQRLCSKLDVPRRPQIWPARQISDSELRALVARLIDDTGLRLSDRVAGLFLICYGQTPARIVRLSVDHVTIDDEQVIVRFGRDQIVLPPAIAMLVASLAGERRGRAATERGGTSRWLFPGAIPGRPLDPGTLRLRLAEIGIPSLQARTASLLELAAQIPSVVLADLVGLDHTTATRWSRAAGGDWATYAAIRATQRSAKPTFS